jgi:hypothetical protein
VLGFVFVSLLVCRAYFRRLARFRFEVRCDEPSPVIGMAVDRVACCYAPLGHDY